MGWYNSNWKYRKKITIDGTKVVGTVTNFPFFVRLVQDREMGFYPLDDGSDILVTAADGITQLPFEIAHYSKRYGELGIYVKIPTLTNGINTEFYIYFGNTSPSFSNNPSDVWSDGYQYVQHFCDPKQGSFKESVSNRNSTPPYIWSKFDSPEFKNLSNPTGDAAKFNGTSGRALQASNLNPSGWSGLQIDIIVNQFDTSDRTALLFGTAPESYSYRIRANGGKLNFGLKTNSTSSTILTSSGTFSANIPTHFSANWSSASGLMNIYKNGVVDSASLAKAGASVFADSIGTINIGTDLGNKHWNGLIYEIRISNVKRSAGYIQTMYNNTMVNSTMAIVGSVETGYSSWPEHLVGYTCREKVYLDYTKTTATVNNEKLIRFPFLVDYYSKNISSHAKQDGSDIIIVDEHGEILPLEFHNYAIEPIRRFSNGYSVVYSNGARTIRDVNADGAFRTGYISNGGYITFNNFKIFETGNRTVKIRYSNGYGNAVTTTIQINGNLVNVVFPATSGWSNYSTVEFTYNFVQENNTIVIGALNNSPDIDWIETDEAIGHFKSFILLPELYTTKDTPIYFYYGNSSSNWNINPASPRFTVETESFTVLNNYIMESNSAYSNGYGLRNVNVGEASAGFTFAGNAGYYDVIVSYLEENDGPADYSLSIGGNIVKSWTSRQLTTSLQLRRTFALAIGQFIMPGQEILINSNEVDAGVYSRIDKIEFIPTNLNMNSIPVWKDYEAVWHLAEPNIYDGAPIYDFSANGRHLFTHNMTSANRVNSNLDAGIQFFETDDLIYGAAFNDLSLSKDNMTFTAWMYQNTTNSVGLFRTGNAYVHLANTQASLMMGGTERWSNVDANLQNQNTFNYFSAIYDKRNSLDIIRDNGIVDLSVSDTNANSGINNWMALGVYQNQDFLTNTENLSGTLAEVRIIKDVKSAEWQKNEVSTSLFSALFFKNPIEEVNKKDFIYSVSINQIVTGMNFNITGKLLYSRTMTIGQIITQFIDPAYCRLSAVATVLVYPIIIFGEIVGQIIIQRYGDFAKITTSGSITGKVFFNSTVLLGIPKILTCANIYGIIKFTYLPSGFAQLFGNLSAGIDYIIIFIRTMTGGITSGGSALDACMATYIGTMDGGIHFTDISVGFNIDIDFAMFINYIASNSGFLDIQGTDLSNIVTYKENIQSKEIQVTPQVAYKKVNYTATVIESIIQVTPQVAYKKVNYTATVIESIIQVIPQVVDKIVFYKATVVESAIQVTPQVAYKKVDYTATYINNSIVTVGPDVTRKVDYTATYIINSIIIISPEVTRKVDYTATYTINKIIIVPQIANKIVNYKATTETLRKHFSYVDIVVRTIYVKLVVPKSIIVSYKNITSDYNSYIKTNIGGQILIPEQGIGSIFNSDNYTQLVYIAEVPVKDITDSENTVCFVSYNKKIEVARKTLIIGTIINIYYNGTINVSTKFISHYSVKFNSYIATYISVIKVVNGNYFSKTKYKYNININKVIINNTNTEVSFATNNTSIAIIKLGGSARSYAHYYNNVNVDSAVWIAPEIKTTVNYINVVNLNQIIVSGISGLVIAKFKLITTLVIILPETKIGSIAEFRYLPINGKKSILGQTIRLVNYNAYGNGQIVTLNCSVNRIATSNFLDPGLDVAGSVLNGSGLPYAGNLPSGTIYYVVSNPVSNWWMVVNGLFKPITSPYVGSSIIGAASTSFDLPSYGNEGDVFQVGSTANGTDSYYYWNGNSWSIISNYEIFYKVVYEGNGVIEAKGTAGLKVTQLDSVLSTGELTTGGFALCYVDYICNNDIAEINKENNLTLSAIVDHNYLNDYSKAILTGASNETVDYCLNTVVTIVTRGIIVFKVNRVLINETTLIFSSGSSLSKVKYKNEIIITPIVSAGSYNECYVEFYLSSLVVQTFELAAEIIHVDYITNLTGTILVENNIFTIYKANYIATVEINGIKIGGSSLSKIKYRATIIDFGKTILTTSLKAIPTYRSKPDGKFPALASGECLSYVEYFKTCIGYMFIPKTVTGLLLILDGRIEAKYVMSGQIKLYGYYLNVKSNYNATINPSVKIIIPILKVSMFSAGKVIVNKIVIDLTTTEGNYVDYLQITDSGKKELIGTVNTNNVYKNKTTIAKLIVSSVEMYNLVNYSYNNYNPEIEILGNFETYAAYNASTIGKKTIIDKFSFFIDYYGTVQAATKQLIVSTIRKTRYVSTYLINKINTSGSIYLNSTNYKYSVIAEKIIATGTVYNNKTIVIATIEKDSIKVVQTYARTKQVNRGQVVVDGVRVVQTLTKAKFLILRTSLVSIETKGGVTNNDSFIIYKYSSIIKQKKVLTAFEYKYFKIYKKYPVVTLYTSGSAVTKYTPTYKYSSLIKLTIKAGGSDSNSFNTYLIITGIINLFGSASVKVKYNFGTSLGILYIELGGYGAYTSFFKKYLTKISGGIIIRETATESSYLPTFLLISKMFKLIGYRDIKALRISNYINAVQISYDKFIGETIPTVKFKYKYLDISGSVITDGTSSYKKINKYIGNGQLVTSGSFDLVARDYVSIVKGLIYTSGDSDRIVDYKGVIIPGKIDATIISKTKQVAFLYFVMNGQIEVLDGKSKIGLGYKIKTIVSPIYILGEFVVCSVYAFKQKVYVLTGNQILNQIRVFGQTATPRRTYNYNGNGVISIMDSAIVKLNVKIDSLIKKTIINKTIIKLNHKVKADFAIIKVNIIAETNQVFICESKINLRISGMCLIRIDRKLFSENGLVTTYGSARYKIVTEDVINQKQNFVNPDSFVYDKNTVGTTEFNLWDNYDDILRR